MSGSTARLARYGVTRGSLPLALTDLANVRPRQAVGGLDRFAMSALPPKADVGRRERHVRYGPIADIAIRMAAEFA
jgi:hypothetical protein